MSGTRQRYVVLVKPPDDHPGMAQIHGPFSSHLKAESFCSNIRAACDGLTERPDISEGYAYVIRLRPPRVREAKKWATKGEA